jgi:CHAD domain-containing protein
MPTTTLTHPHPELTADAAVDALRAAGFEVDPPKVSQRVVLDTFDGRLHRAGLRLEARSGDDSGLVLVDRRGAPPARLEWRGTPRWPTELPVGPFRSRVLRLTQERALLPLVTITSAVREARRLDRRGKVVARAELHERVAANGHVLASWLLELSGVAGHDDAEAQAVHRLAACGLEAEPCDFVSAVAAASGHDLRGHERSPMVALDRREPALDGYRRVLANLAATIDDNLAGTIEDIDIEFLHELRVAVRRTRSVLAEAKGVIPPDIRDRYREAFGWLGDVTSPPRDLDVYVVGWDDYVAPLAAEGRDSLDRVLAALQRRRKAAHAELARTLRSDACREVLDGWTRWLADPHVSPLDARHLGPVVARRVAKAQHKVLTDGRSITPDTPAERLHDLRKDTKKLRYLLECFGSLFPAKDRKAFVAQLKALQDNLGEHQDAEVHLAQLRDLAHDLHARATVDTDALLAMGRLSDHLDRRRAEERAAFVDRFAAYDTKANHRILDAMLRKASNG